MSEAKQQARWRAPVRRRAPKIRFGGRKRRKIQPAATAATAGRDHIPTLADDIHAEIGAFIGLGYFRLRACSRALRALLTNGLPKMRARLRVDQLETFIRWTPAYKGDTVLLRTSAGLREHTYWHRPRCHSIRSQAPSMLSYACNLGYLTVAQWLVARFDLAPRSARSKKNAARYSKNAALRDACRNGHLEVAQWLVSCFHLTAADARDDGNYTLYLACEEGHLGVVQWLVTRFELGAADMRGTCGSVLGTACESGHLEVAVWLAERFGTDTMSCIDHARALRSACRHGWLPAVQWLLKRADLVYLNVCEPPQAFLKEACLAGHLAIAVCLVESLGLAASDMRSCMSSDPATIAWLETFGETAQ